MKTSIKSLLFACIVVATASCKKEVTPNIANSIQSTASEDIYAYKYDSRWIGLVSDGYYPYEIDTVKDRNFISNGVAELDNSPWPYYWTNIQLSIPPCHALCGDSTRFEVSLKNPSGRIGSITDYDVDLFIVGSKNTAHVTFIGIRQEFTSYGVGNTQVSNIPELVYLFQNFTTIALEAKNKTLNVYKQGTQILSLPYPSVDRIGKIKSIQISFKGTGTADWVKLYNSNTNKQVMQEDFNVDGHSSVVWY